MLKNRVLIADDHPFARKAIQSLLTDDPSFEIIGEATDGLEAVQLCSRLEPEVVLMDINMPRMNGLEATRKIKNDNPHIKVVILTVSDDAADLFTALQYGAQGYLLKNMAPDDWSRYLHALLDENSEISRQMADRLFQQFKAGHHAEYAPLQVLTPREQEIISCVAAGSTNKQIAEQLVISENTVKNHLKNILEKLSLENRVQLTSYAIRNGLTQNIQNNNGR
ncbi:DNA-binding response regulator [Paenibacillus nanensis]|uniref:DNA-binding response regulator n=1 Tax=Paenibacillus nanensis TaxID=393251 RepID=A0A3A1UZ99_9BACL|nr:response regulator transcription factor [Paenibacillus nanensis]RIX53919.1 DNA-binding response regulator [Paenibacillus nanensis]